MPFRAGIPPKLEESEAGAASIAKLNIEIFVWYVEIKRFADFNGGHMDRHRLLLTLTALGCFGISLMHVLLGFGGVEIDRFFGAPQFILQLVAEGSLLVPAMTLGIALLFAIFGFYALSGAGRFRRLPLLKSILLGLGVILTYRGTAIIISIQNIFKYPDYSTWQFPVMSLASLLLGLISLWGTLGLLKSERRQRLTATVLN